VDVEARKKKKKKDFHFEFCSPTLGFNFSFDFIEFFYKTRANKLNVGLDSSIKLKQERRKKTIGLNEKYLLMVSISVVNLFSLFNCEQLRANDEEEL
jgi:hypothetical protein